MVVQDGRPLTKVLDCERLTTADVLDAAREQGIADLQDVRLAVLEADGKFSFIKRDESRPLEPEKHEL